MDPKKISAQTIDIVLIDIIGFSKLDDPLQYRVIVELTEQIKHLLSLHSSLTLRSANELIIHYIPTGDGAYFLINPILNGYGVFLALSLRNYILSVKKHSKYNFIGIRAACNHGIVMPFDDISGNTNYVGSGLNDCFRILRPIKQDVDRFFEKNGDSNFVVCSSAAIECFRSAYSSFLSSEDIVDYDFSISDPLSIKDKHGRSHQSHFVEMNRNILPNPPLPGDIESRLRGNGGG